MHDLIQIRGKDLLIEELLAVAKHKCPVALSQEAKEKIEASHALVYRKAHSDEAVYGINTGFGEFSTKKISLEENGALQRNLILSHACGVGEPFDEVVVRAIMLLRVNTLACGYSGVSPAVVELLIAFLNHDILPVIPSQGSLGASGDLANLAHMALALLGEGKVDWHGQRMPASEALEKAQLTPVRLRGKDGLAIINGTQIMAAIGVLSLVEVENCLMAANIGAALSFEALRGTTKALDPRIHAARPHPGQIETAEILRKLLQGSIAVNTRTGDVQDPYTLRCVPQVHGAVADACRHVRRVLEIEINSVTDNPLVFLDTEELISGGNFHGEPLALALDYLGMAAAELASMSERRIERLVNPQLNGSLPAFLVEEGGVNSGFMIPQYVAASLVSENKVLAHPASVDSIPSSANKEDHVSMGSVAARMTAKIARNVRQVLAIEWLCAAQACDLRGYAHLGFGSQQAYEAIRSVVPFLSVDRILADDMEALAQLIANEACMKHIMDSLDEASKER